MIRRAIRLAGARGLLPYLTLGYATFLVFLAIWGTRIPAEQVARIARLIPFSLVYAAAAVHLACCCLLFWPVLRQRLSLAPPPGDPGAPIVWPDGAALAALARRHRLRLAALPGGGWVLCRHRFSAIGTLLFHAALLLLPLAWAASEATRFRGDAWILEGHAFTGARAEYVRVEPADGFEARAPRLTLEVERVEAELWGPRLFFTELRALVATGAGAARRAAWIRLPEPLRVGDTRVTLRGFSYSLAFELVRGGHVIEGGDLNLRLFPPGTPDSFAVPGLPHRIHVRAYAEAGGYALERPRLFVAVTLGKRLVASGFRQLGEPLAFDGHAVSFPALLRGGEILVHRDLGYPLLWLALGLALAGLVLRIGFPPARAWILGGPSAATLVVREDAFAHRSLAALVGGAA